MRWVIKQFDVRMNDGGFVANKDFAGFVERMTKRHGIVYTEKLKAAVKDQVKLAG